MMKFILLLGCLFAAEEATAQDTTRRKSPEMITKNDPRADTIGKQFIIDNEPQPLTPLNALIVYPYEARRAGLEGKVIISAIVDTNGKVLKVRIDESTDKIFEEPAKEAMLKCQFTPAYKDGRPIKIWYTVPISFRLPQE